MDLFFLLIAAVLLILLGASFGRGFTKFPSEEEMLQRLIRARTERKLEAFTKDQVEQEIEQGAERELAKLTR